LGVVVVIFIGGILNALGIAYGVSVWLVLLIGLSRAILAIRRLSEQPIILSGRFCLPGFIVAGATFFVVITLFPADVFNYHDDFQKYFSHPIRMLQTGSLSGGPLSALGSETLGAQAFIQGAVIWMFPIEYIGVIDYGLGYFICLCLAAQVGFASRHAGLSLSAIPLAAVILIHPQYVNVSGLFVPAALMMYAVSHSLEPRINPNVLGLVYGALVAIKPTTLVFVGMHAAVMVTVAFLADKIKAFRFCARLLVATICGILPWLLLHTGAYFSGFHPAMPMLGHYFPPIELFSMEPLYYGANQFAYTALVLCVIGTATTSCWAAKCQRAVQPWRLFGFAAGLGVVYLAILYGMGHLYGAWAAVRYFTPIAIGAIPVLLANINQTLLSTPKRLRVVLGIELLALSCFVPSFAKRVSDVFRFGTALSLKAVSDLEYRSYSRFVLSGAAQHQIEEAQAAIPAGEPFVAWLNYPFYLDFRRNPIYELDTAGLSTPWSGIPAVNYVIWARQGYATRPYHDYVAQSHDPGLRERLIGFRSRAATTRLAESISSGELIWQRDGIFVYRVNGRASEL
jgi:hypothetical protein